MENPGLSLALLCLMAVPALPADAADFSLTTAESFTAGSTPTVRVSGYGFKHLHFRLYRLSEEAKAAEAPALAPPRFAGALVAKASPQARLRLREILGLGWVPPFEPRGGGVPVSDEHVLVAAWGRGFPGTDWVFEDVAVPAPGPGAYVFEAVTGRDSARTLVLVSDLGGD